MTLKIAARHSVGLAVLVLIGLTANLLWSAEPKEPMHIVKTIDLDECEPYQVRDKIMALHPANGTIVVAEREIRALDVDAEGKPIKTEFLAMDGKPESPSAFGVGQYVWVKGVLHPDGFVAAFVVQKIVKPQAVKFIPKTKAERQAKARKAGHRLVAPAAGSN
jgi:hypothetical protein